MAMDKPKSVAAYLAAQPKATRALLKKLRSTVRRALPEAVEDISYGIPVLRVEGRPALFFAGWSTAVSLYPIGDAVRAALGKDIAPWVAGKGTLRFPFGQPLPLKLIARLAKVRGAEVAGKGARPAGRGASRATATASRKAAAPSKAGAKKQGAVADYVAALPAGQATLARLLRREIDAALPKAESRLWHGHPVWFDGQNPIVGFDARKASVGLLFWNGRALDEPALLPTGKYKAAGVQFARASEVEKVALRRWLKKARANVFDGVTYFRRLREKARRAQG